MCAGCKELRGWELDVYSAALDVLDRYGLGPALNFLVRMEAGGPRGSGVYAKVAPMVREHAAAA